MDFDSINTRHMLIVGKMDRALARHYGLTAEELDFVINYDVKYRMGASAEEGENE
jgi:hypothetical protein